MNVSVGWLRDLVPGLREPPQALADRLSMRAVPVDEVVPVGEGLAGLRVARVLEVNAHPGADRLTVCRVDPGDGEPVDVVCGAPDVREGGLYPYVAPGGELPGGLRVETREIRGETSHGMLCSEKELGVGQDAAGLMALPPDAEPGQLLTEVLSLPDARLVLDLTPNRVDLACHVGVAREVAPGGTAEVVLPHFQEAGWEPEWVDGEQRAEAAGVTVEIEDPERCRRYLGAVIRGVEVGPSPSWLVARLRAVGARPVNNVVDATNFVLYELNQPLHAFDLDRLSGPAISVRAARPGETLLTLDGEERKLSPDATVIADAERAVALAGVMGGEETEVTADTRNIFLECAAFDPRSVRHTARGVELDTEASYRFERGIDETGLERAITRCVELILTLAGGEAEILAPRTGGGPPAARVLELRRSRVGQVLGKDFKAGEIRRLLDPLGFVASEEEQVSPTERLVFRVPGWRGDVTREIDLVEEVARRFGYENFSTERRAVRTSTVPDDPIWARTDRVRELFEARGFLEARSSSLVSREEADPAGPLPLLHPLSEEERYLRGAIVPVLLRRLEHNFARGVRDVRLYEIGTVFRKTPTEEVEEGDREAHYGEEIRVGAVFVGRRRPEHWDGEAGVLDLWDLKDLAEEVARHLCDAELLPTESPDREALDARFASSRWIGPERFHVIRRSVPVGLAGGVRPEAVDAPPWAESVWALECRLDAVVSDPSFAYRELSPFPPVRRDLAVVLPEDVPAGSVEEAIREAAPGTLERLRLFDVYAGEGVEAGRRSLAYRLRFRATDRTLEDAEVEAAVEEILERLRERFDARLRAG